VVIDFVHYTWCIFDIKSIKPLTVLKMIFKGTQGYQQWCPSLDRLDFLSETRKVGYSKLSNNNNNNNNNNGFVQCLNADNGTDMAMVGVSLAR